MKARLSLTSGSFRAHKKTTWKKDIKSNWQVYTLFLPTFIFLFVLSYIPMVGIVTAFQNYKPSLGIFGSRWEGFSNFIELFSSSDFYIALRNTFFIGLLRITVGFIAPIIFAILLSMVRFKKFKRFCQTLSYLPNFVAAVIVCSLLAKFVDTDGPITMFLVNVFGITNENLLANDKIPVFWLIYTFMGIWQGIGWGSIMYVAAISTVNGDLYEAAALDGASRLQRLFKITIPCILPTIIMMFVVNVGISFSAGYDSILLLYMPKTYNVADTVYTYTYRVAFGDGSKDYGLSAASGLFQSVVSTILLVGSNWLSKKVNDGVSLF